ncbi:uncharacterized protein LOC129000742 [Macrosteles quadrilineatus]|uniref:uncharacterized protein LOC129000742 n=1 Tax=Macrosteles quadrilineatus TaxID=74068 RepID=UPI0023E2B7CF|nr:uncharacterized protein LOC129000742 [Macrosteles quadrilineatus]
MGWCAGDVGEGQARVRGGSARESAAMGRAGKWRLDTVALVSVLSCEDTWSLYRQTDDDGLLFIAATEASCPRLPSSSAVTMPLVSLGSELPQLLLDVRTAHHLEWKSVAIICDHTMDGELIKSMVDAFTTETIDTKFKSLLVMVYRIAPAETEWERRKNVVDLLSTVPKIEENSNFLVALNFDLIGVILDVIKQLNLMKPTCQWLFVIPHKISTNHLHEFAGHLQEGGNVAFLYNSSTSHRRCQNGLACHLEGLMQSLVMGLDIGTQAELDKSKKVSEEEWEQIKPTRTERKNSLLQFILKRSKTEVICDNCTVWRALTAELWGQEFLNSSPPDHLLDIGYWNPREGCALTDLLFKRSKTEVICDNCTVWRALTAELWGQEFLNSSPPDHLLDIGYWNPREGCALTDHLFVEAFQDGELWGQEFLNSSPPDHLLDIGYWNPREGCALTDHLFVEAFQDGELWGQEFLNSSPPDHLLDIGYWNPREGCALTDLLFVEAFQDGELWGQEFLNSSPPDHLLDIGYWNPREGCALTDHLFVEAFQDGALTAELWGQEFLNSSPPDHLLDIGYWNPREGCALTDHLFVEAFQDGALTAELWGQEFLNSSPPDHLLDIGYWNPREGCALTDHLFVEAFQDGELWGQEFLNSSPPDHLLDIGYWNPREGCALTDHLFVEAFQDGALTAELWGQEFLNSSPPDHLLDIGYWNPREGCALTDHLFKRSKTEVICDNCTVWRALTAELWGQEFLNSSPPDHLLDIGYWNPREGCALTDHLFVEAFQDGELWGQEFLNSSPPDHLLDIGYWNPREGCALTDLLFVEAFQDGELWGQEFLNSSPPDHLLDIGYWNPREGCALTDHLFVEAFQDGALTAELWGQEFLNSSPPDHLLDIGYWNPREGCALTDHLFVEAFQDGALTAELWGQEFLNSSPPDHLLDIGYWNPREGCALTDHLFVEAFQDGELWGQEFLNSSPPDHLLDIGYWNPREGCALTDHLFVEAFQDGALTAELWGQEFLNSSPPDHLLDIGYWNPREGCALTDHLFVEAFQDGALTAELWGQEFLNSSPPDHLLDIGYWNPREGCALTDHLFVEAFQDGALTAELWGQEFLNSSPPDHLLDIGYWNPREGCALTDHLFPHAKYGFRKMSLPVASFNYPPWQIIQYNQSGHPTEYKGVVFEMLNLISKKYNFSYYVINPWNNSGPPDHKYGGNFSSQEKFDHKEDSAAMIEIQDVILSFVKQKKIFLGACALTITENKASYVNFTDPVSIETYVFLVSRPKELSRALLFILPFTSDAWLCIVSSIGLMAPILHLVHRLSPYYDYFGISKVSGLGRITNCFWYVYGALLQQGGAHLPLADSGRLIIGTWWIVVLVVVTTYCGNLVAFLTFPKMDKLITNVHDLLLRKDFLTWGIPDLSYIKSQLMTAEDPLLQEVYNRAKIHQSMTPEVIEAVRSGRHAYIQSKTRLLYLMKNQFLTTNTCDFSLGNEEFMQEKLGMVMSRDNPYLELFNKEIGKMHRLGLVRKWMVDYLPSRDRCWGNLYASEVNNHTVNLDDMQGSFFLLLLGIFLSFITIVLEIFIKKRIQSKEQRIIQPFVQ